MSIGIVVLSPTAQSVSQSWIKPADNITFSSGGDTGISSNPLIGYFGGEAAIELCGCSDTTVLPADADPPFPPVWPYNWDSSLLYGREHLTQNLKMIRRDTYKFRSTITKNGVVVDLTGATLVLSAKWDRRDAGTIFTCTSGDGLTITTPTAGIIDVTIAPSKTSGLPAYTVMLPYDIQLTEASGDVSTPQIGILTVIPDIT